ncbi:MAG TPA: glycosyltransferase [Blastocatellia bacterium]|nr:glycosyltransferase [Blastocatellia bacterium]
MQDKVRQPSADHQSNLVQRARLALRQELPHGKYRAFRAALRVLVPHPLRRRAVQLVRSRFGLLPVANLLTDHVFSKRQTQTPLENFTGGDFYRSVTLLPHLPEPEVKAILNHPLSPISQSRADVICFSIIDWSFRFQRPQQIMSQFAAHGHRVFYLSVSKFRSRYARPKFAVKQIAENIFEVEIAARYPLDIFHEVIEGKDLELALGSLDQLRREFSINEAISYVMIPSWCQAALETQRQWNWRVVYDCMDEWENFPGIKPASLEAETRLVEQCDLLVVTAQRLLEKWQSRTKPTVLARNAADYEFYARRCQPNALLAETKHPVIGYFGAIADWFDVDLLADAAEQRPNYTFVLLGGVFETDVSRLQALPNVKLLGQQPYETMPQYLHHFDVCTIPFKINPITEATDPVKLYEYWSGGKPVVASKMAELEHYRDHVYLAENTDDFVAKLDAALAESDPQLAEQRKALARQHTWKTRYDQIAESLRQLVPRASIIIVTYNNLALSKLCLESVLRNTEYPNFEVIVVDNDSKDDTPPYLQQLARLEPSVKVLLNKQNYGFAKANNQGIELATGEHIILLNNDAIVPPGWLSRLLRHLNDPQVGMVGPVTNFVGNEAKINVNYKTWRQMEVFAQRQCFPNDLLVSDIHMLAMFCVALRRDTFSQIGPLDERFGIGMFEDDDYSIRIKQAGYRIVCAADVFVHHFGQAAFGKLIKSGTYDRLFEENRRQYEAKWKTVWQPHQNVPLKLEKHQLEGKRN